MDEDEKRRDQLTTAPAATEADAEPRIETDRSTPGVRKVRVRDDAEVRPGSD